jgi:hypothetical protein
MDSAKSKLDLFPTNPSWKISGVPTIFTYKTLFITLVLIAISILLAFPNI